MTEWQQRPGHLETKVVQEVKTQGQNTMKSVCLLFPSIPFFHVLCFAILSIQHIGVWMY